MFTMVSVQNALRNSEPATGRINIPESSDVAWYGTPGSEPCTDLEGANSYWARRSAGGAATVIASRDDGL